jgi:hypothetical protein
MPSTSDEQARRDLAYSHRDQVVPGSGRAVEPRHLEPAPQLLPDEPPDGTWLHLPDLNGDGYTDVLCRDDAEGHNDYPGPDRHWWSFHRRAWIDWPRAVRLGAAARATDDHAGVVVLIPALTGDPRDFYVPDEPVEDVVAAFNAATKQPAPAAAYRLRALEAAVAAMRPVVAYVARGLPHLATDTYPVDQARCALTVLPPEP